MFRSRSKADSGLRPALIVKSLPIRASVRSSALKRIAARPLTSIA
jgi:hypothetical protein